MKMIHSIQERLMAYPSFRERDLNGRFIHQKMLMKILNNSIHDVEEVGRSVLGLPIDAVTLGSGPIKVLMWSQMHGNESTTTKAAFDMMNYLASED